MSLVTAQDIYNKHDIDAKNIPEHIAIIMDGNGRWAKKRLLPRSAGHKAGKDTLKQILKDCAVLGVKHLTVYAFSTENWTRPEEEVGFIMKLLKSAIFEELRELKSEGVKLTFLGALDELPDHVKPDVYQAMEDLKDGDKIQLNIMLNYGSRREIVDAVKEILKNPTVDPTTLTEDDISNALYTSGIPDPDILIRPGGEFRISNYLLWQIAYSEIFVIDTLWPDFKMADLATIISQFQKRDRRYGGLNED